jgi:hypothetical protein
VNHIVGNFLPLEGDENVERIIKSSGREEERRFSINSINVKKIRGRTMTRRIL